jgi:dienelactone hydrolase
VFVDPAQPTNWRELVQKPHEKLPLKDLGLKPLLETPDGKKITTVAEWDRQRERLRAAWMERLGTPPPRPDRLDVKIESTEKVEGHQRQLLTFLTEGDDVLRTYLLIPPGIKKGEKRAAVVVFHQTSRDTLKEPVGLGKKPELALALHLVKRGYIVLCPECYILKDPVGWAKGQAESLAKRRPGWTGMGKMTFDASRCIDFLETLPEVDRERIGCIGHSLGAKEVLYALAFEKRYKAGVFSEGGIGLRMSNWTDSWYLTSKMKEHIPAMENHQVMALATPKPLLIVAGDSADSDTSWTFVKSVLPVYELLGAGEKVGLINHRKGHTFPADAQEFSYRWLDHWLR